jgi:translocation and assembly module TamB
MTDAVATDMPPARPRRPPPGAPRRPGRLIAYWLGGILLGLAALVLLATVAINTAPGRRLLVQYIEGMTQPNGLRVHIGRIDGSIYGRMRLNDIALYDSRGVFLTAPSLDLDWTPAELLHKHVLLNEVASPSIRLLRAPAFRPTPPKPNEPILPDIYLTVKRLAIGRLLLEPAVTGDRRSLGIAASVELLHRRVRVQANATALAVDGHAGGDGLTVQVDAEPSADRLTIDAHLTAPQGGVVDRLAKLGAPLTFDLTGAGTWRAWNGRAVSGLGGQSLLDAAIEAHSGVFHVKGEAQPALIVKSGPVKALTDPALAFDVTAKMQDRQLDLDARVGSSAIDVAARGRLDLAHSRFVAVKVDARLLKPQAASPKLSGRDVRASLTLNGAMGQPVVDYDIAAAQIGFDQTLIQALHVTGKAQVDANQTLRLPVHATAARVLGLPEAAGGLTTNLKVDGDVMISAKQIASDNLRIRSDQLDATLVMALSLDTGRYNAVLKGRINRYQINGLGLVDLTTDAHLIPTGKGQFRVGGHIHVVTERLDNPQGAAQLGGRAVIDADFSRTPDGTFGVANLHLASPKFRITDGHGRYLTDGRIDFVASAVSAMYGPLKLQIGGTIKSPVARLLAPNPGVGGLTGLDVTAKGSGPNAYLVTAAAQSPYGAVSAEVQLHLGKGALEADIRHASVDGISVTGAVRQTPAGPFAGTLRLTGSGLSGTATLSGVGKVQRVDLALRASNARLPLTPPITIARGNATITAILYPNAPAITAKATLAGVRREQLLIANATAELRYQGGTGRATLSADGSNSVPFSIAADAGISPDLIRVDGQGSVNHVALRLAGPADIRKTKGGYALSPTTVLLPQGRLTLAGASGASGVTASVRAEAVDLSIAQAFAPTLGVGGKVSGAADVSLPSGGGMPTGKMNLQVSGFTRAGLTTVTEPVDVALLATLAQNGAEAHALVRRRGAIIGRLQGKLTPGGGTHAQPWLARLEAAPLTGGVRYDGPSEALWGLSGISGQSLSGPIAIGVDVSGQLERPQVRGVIRAQALRYSNDTLGTVIDHIALNGDFTDTRFELQTLTGQAGKGTLAASGYADLSSAKGFPIALNAKLANAVLARSDDVGATVSGDLAITNDKAKGALVSGKLTLNSAAYEIVKQGAGQVVELAGVRRKGQPLGAPITPTDAKAAAAGPPSVWKLDIAVDAPAHILVRGMGLDAEWSTTLRITGDAAHPVVVGDVRLVRGTFSFAGRALTLSTGVIHLDGSNPPDPTLNIVASATVDSTTATITIGGTASDPQITFSSVPALAQDEVLSRLLFGSSVAQISPLQAVQLAAALNSLRGSSGGGFNPLGKLRSAAGLDRLNFYGANTATGQGPSVGAGQYISNNIYVEVTTDTKGYTATQIEIALTRSLKLLSAVGALGTSNVGMKYSHDY